MALADILKVTTPLVNKNQTVLPKPGAESITPFNLQNTTQVIRSHNQSELLGQNNTALENREGASILMDLLKDPSVTVSYLKNIFLLEEMFKLLPANNSPVTREIEMLFQSLLTMGQDVAPELSRQADGATLFRGELFDFLRALSTQSPQDAELQRGIANLLKSLNGLIHRGNLRNAAANNLTFLGEAVSASPELSARLLSLAARFRAGTELFQALKAEALAIRPEVEESILFSPRLGKILSILAYNLSRYNGDDSILDQSALRLRQQLPLMQRQKLSELLSAFLNRRPWEGIDGAAPANSRVMEALTALLERQSGDEARTPADAARVDSILHSLLSSPCNFTPLLHFVVPAFFNGARAFAELWINPESDERDMPPGTGPGLHLLLVADIEALGRVEAELFVHDAIVDLNIYFPPGYEKPFAAMLKDLPSALTGLPYRLGRTQLSPLEKPRSLMDVFKSLPYKRVGVDVKI